MKDKVKVLHLVTEPTRFRLLELLTQRHYCVRVLAIRLGISESAVSQHLSMLKKYGIVTSKRIGYQTHYMVNRALIADALQEMMQLVSDPVVDAEPEEKCSCEFMPECIRQEGTRKKGK
ncbi:MAG: metalloregulator ArsR/SmtB family transcription factor [Lachnospiraceae bacterium]|nr:metalloregulator ArsR/SmtB family transcription factor [Lachnospiraceae bacterium]